jgi:hypothetical protein
MGQDCKECINNNGDNCTVLEDLNLDGTIDMINEFNLILAAICSYYETDEDTE